MTLQCETVNSGGIAKDASDLYAASRCNGMFCIFFQFRISDLTIIQNEISDCELP